MLGCLATLKRGCHRPHAAIVEPVGPYAVLLHGGTHDQCVRSRKSPDILRGDPRAHQRRNADRLANRAHLVGISRAARGGAGNNHAICLEELRGPGRLNQIHVGSDGVRGMRWIR